MEEKMMTFQELMDCFVVSKDFCNAAIYEELREELQINKRLIPFVGAGLSCWAEYPLWSKLLLKLAEGKPISKRVENLVKTFQYEKAGSVLEKFLKHNLFLDKVVEAFPPENMKEEKRHNYQKLLKGLFEGPVITTNFDVCLERVFTDPYVVCPEDNFQKKGIEAKLQGYKPVFIKLHGTINDPEHMIFTEERYNDVYGADERNPDIMLPVPAALSKAFTTAPFLFLGCSLGPDRTCAVLKACNGKGYALLELPEETENKADPLHPNILEGEDFIPSLNERMTLLDELHLKVIWYPHGMHTAVDALIQQLYTDVKLSSPEEIESDTYASTAEERQEAFYKKPAHFQNRDYFTKQIADKIKDQSIPIVVVNGMAGIGKTEICKAAYRKIRKTDIAFSMPYIDLSTCDNIENVMRKIAEENDIILPETIPSNKICNHLFDKILVCARNGKMIAFLDNFEEIWTKLDQKQKETLYNQLLKLANAGLRFLIASQIELPFPGSVEIIAMDRNNMAKLSKLKWDDFKKLNSVSLFFEILNRELAPKEQQALKKLIAETGGHPLAIMLTAYNARSMSINTLLKNWNKVAVSCLPGDRDSHKSLTQAFALTWNTVKENQAAVLRWALHSLSVYPLDEEVLSALKNKLDNSISEEEWTKGGQLLRKFGLIDYGNDGREGMLLSVKRALSNFDEEVILEALEAWAEWSNEVQAAGDNENPNHIALHDKALEYLSEFLYLAEYCLDKKQYDLLYKVIDNIANYTYSEATESIHMVERVLKETGSSLPKRSFYTWLYSNLLLYTNDIGQAQKECDKAEKLCQKEQDNLVMAHVMNTKGELFQLSGKTKEAMEAFTEAKKLYEEKKNNQGLANALYNQAYLLHRTGKIDEAMDTYDAAEKKYRKIHDNQGLANIFLYKGDIFQTMGKITEAKKNYDEADRLYREEKDYPGMTFIMLQKGELLNDMGQMNEAKQFYNAAEKLCRMEQDDSGLVSILQSRADFLINISQYCEAKNDLDEAEKLCRKVKDNLGLANVKQSRGDLLKEFALYKNAIKAYDEAEKIYQKQEDHLGQANILKSKGDIYKLTDYIDDAQKAYDAAITLYQMEKYMIGQASIIQSRGELFCYKECYDQAAKEYTEAEKIYQTCQYVHGMAEIHLVRGEMYQKQEKYKEAISSYRKALPLFQQLQSIVGQCFIFFEMEFCQEKLGKQKQAIECEHEANELMRSLPKEVQDNIRKQLQKKGIC